MIPDTAARPGVIVLLIVLCVAPDVNGQVWLPERGEGSFALTYHALSARDHLDSNGRPYDKGQITNLGLLVSGEFGLTDKVTLEGNLALVAGRHRGADSFHGPLDTGIYHGAIQDTRLAIRIGFPARAGFTVTPFAGAIIPSHDYEFRGHSAPGRRLRALQVGAGVGRDLGPALRKGYVQALYAFALVERVGGMSINRSNLDIETGYALAPFITVMLSGALQRTHGGLIFPLSVHYHGDERRALEPFHDRVARANHFLMTSGATIPVSRSIAVYTNGVWTVSGANTHSVKGFVVGMSWSFSRGMTLRGKVSPARSAGMLRDGRSGLSPPAAEF